MAVCRGKRKSAACPGYAMFISNWHSRRMYLRFVTGMQNDASGVREGIFHAAYDLRRSRDLPAADERELTALLDWFEKI